MSVAGGLSALLPASAAAENDGNRKPGWSDRKRTFIVFNKPDYHRNNLCSSHRYSLFFQIGNRDKEVRQGTDVTQLGGVNR